MIKKIYYWLYRATSRPDERGEYSGGWIQGAIRRRALDICAGIRGKALEIGFGAGLFVLKLAEGNPGLEVWGMDSNAALLGMVRQKAAELRLSNLHLITDDARKLPFPDGTFDAVICVNFFVNMDLEAMGGILKEMRRVCADTGRVIFEFRSSRNILFALKYRLARLYDATAPHPLYTFDPDDVEEMLVRTGLRALRKSFIGFPLKRYAPIILIEAART